MNAHAAQSTRLTIAAFVSLFVVLGIAYLILGHRPVAPNHAGPPPAAAPAAPAAPATATSAPTRSPKMAALAAHIGPDAISPIARDLDAPGGTIQHDEAILNQVFEAWQTNFPHQGNPVGTNAEITAALAGDNPLHFAFIAPTSRAINARGQLCDRWGTPFRLHQLSGTEMELWSAGPDRRFATPDDVRFAPWRN